MAMSQAEALASVDPELREIFVRLVNDYNKAKTLHVPNYKGGPSYAILAELVKLGWRRN